MEWKIVCTPKEHGGLGIKSMEWNEVLLMKQLWKIIERKDTLWFKWGTRDKVKRHVHYVIGNEEHTSIWFDSGSAMGSLDQLISRRERYNARFKDDRTMAQYRQIVGDDWPEEWKSKFPILNHVTIPNLQNVDDQVLWLSNNGTKVHYSTKQAWLDLRLIGATKRWYHVVWFNQIIPKHAFVLWLAIWDRLSTKIRIQR
ncbi:uncharacterized protein [Rutidosis leptorrhynchoides]|uniref:uncharacterized protein n=1 Tax=Rutidosis leptorrhynchoides TaxID=125765 RepID=UPI003A9A341E